MSTDKIYNAGSFNIVKILKEQILMHDHELSRLGKEDFQKQIEILQVRIEELLGRYLTERECEDLI